MCGDGRRSSAFSKEAKLAKLVSNGSLADSKYVSAALLSSSARVIRRSESTELYLRKCSSYNFSVSSENSAFESFAKLSQLFKSFSCFFGGFLSSWKKSFLSMYGLLRPVPSGSSSVNMSYRSLAVVAEDFNSSFFYNKKKKNNRKILFR